jgi:hypothetical protein
MAEKADLPHDASASLGHGRFEIELLLYESTQEVRNENFSNRSIRSVVRCRHVPLSSHGESGVQQLHNFINPEQAVSTVRRSASGLDDDGHQLWRYARLPVQNGIHERESQISDGARL